MKSVLSSFFFLASFLFLYSFAQSANENAGPKILKPGELYVFQGRFADGKTTTAEVKCLKENELSHLSDGCGHTKHCTIMKSGEVGQTAHMNFKCSE